MNLPLLIVGVLLIAGIAVIVAKNKKKNLPQPGPEPVLSRQKVHADTAAQAHEFIRNILRDVGVNPEQATISVSFDAQADRYLAVADYYA